MIQFVCEKLLEAIINQLTEKTDPTNKEVLLINLCRKELSVISKLKIEGIDMTGTAQEVEERIESQSIYFMGKEEFDQIKEKADRFDAL
ncbi:hypothetical protein BXY41_11628 [Lacrimispora xylanisolvens]|uniref:Uncharacterized protein n=1 Tax=Lacrimispora xylanisolvens TaxID=384636 RepID=A0A2S6HJ52_9FIRM|nr:hypothetical protein [Hungatella xylanolytica]PPK77490.1 hypothetical protein BXY41_11628 [Hungatella xylanolytica]